MLIALLPRKSAYLVDIQSKSIDPIRNAVVWSSPIAIAATRLHRHHLPLEHLQLQPFQFVLAAQRTGKAAITFSEKLRYLVKRAEAGCMPPFYWRREPKSAHQPHHDRRSRPWQDGSGFRPHQTGRGDELPEETATEQLDQSSGPFSTPDEYSGTKAVGRGVLDRHSMSHVFGRETERARNTVRS